VRLLGDERGSERMNIGVDGGCIYCRYHRTKKAMSMARLVFNICFQFRLLL
jgi:hypothetical protein